MRAGAETPADMTVIRGRPLRGVVIDRETDKPVADILVGCYGPARSPIRSRRRVAQDGRPGPFHVPCPARRAACLSHGWHVVQPPESPRSGRPRTRRDRALPAAADRDRESGARCGMMKAANSPGTTGRGQGQGRDESRQARAAKKELAGPRSGQAGKSPRRPDEPDPEGPHHHRPCPRSQGPAPDRGQRVCQSIRPVRTFEQFDSAATDRDGMFILSMACRAGRSRSI